MRCSRMILMVSMLSLIVAGSISVASASDEKIPITTSSAAARDLYVQGREYQENLRATDARTRYREAIEEDADFALAHFGLANTSTTAQEFFGALDRAVELAPGVSEGERLMILGLEAGVKSNPDRQGELLGRLVELFPEAERAHNQVANYYFGRQEYDRAIAHYEQSTAINPRYSPPYNNMGYAYRFTDDYTSAEKAFQKYVELLPNEPNPYDSLAEFLMKVGRFEESIENYKKALEINPSFMPSFSGIGHNQVFLGRAKEAQKTYREMHAAARTIVEKRQALFQSAVAYVHAGNHDQALDAIKREYELAAVDNDLNTLVADLNAMGNILLEAGRYDEALARFDRAVGIGERADVPEEVHEATRRNHLYNVGRVALKQGDMTGARRLAAQYTTQVAVHSALFEVRQSHRLAAMIALQGKDYDTALEHLAQDTIQNPRVLYLTALAYFGQGDNTRGREYCEKAASFNALGIQYAYVRTAAMDMLKHGSSALD